jgi:integrase/recombinase XerD
MLLNDYLFTFFKENNITETNQKIVIDYLDSFIVEKDVTEATIRNQREIMIHILRHLNKDLDKLTQEDIRKYLVSVSKLTRVRDGKPASKGTKKMYRAGFSQFLRWASKEYKKPEYKEFLEPLNIKVKIERKNPNDLFTKDEIDRMINSADNTRDQAILAVLAESGCRVGEFISSRISDVKQTDDFVFLTFRRGKTGLRTVPLKESIIYLNRWLENHPLKNNPNAALWVSLNEIPFKLKHPEEGKGYKPMTENSVLCLVQRTAKRVGITKRVYTHLFRHYCATQLAKEGMSEPLMRVFLGWDEDSDMPSRYVRLSGQDIEDAQRKRLGMVKDKEPEKRFQICPRCKNEMPARVEFCMTCGEALKQDKSKTIEDGVKTMISDEVRNQVEQMFLNNPNKFNLIRSKLQNQN